MNIFKKALSKCGTLSAATSYHYLSIKNRYPCRVVGERVDPKNRGTVVIYKVLPKKEEFEINLRDLLDQPLLIEKFHPTEAIRLGFMAFGDLFFNQTKEKAFTEYQNIIEKMSKPGDH